MKGIDDYFWRYNQINYKKNEEFEETNTDDIESIEKKDEIKHEENLKLNKDNVDEQIKNILKEIDSI
jgi:hypothetical protein